MKMKTDDRIGYAHADKLLLPNNLLLRELEEMLADERTVMLKRRETVCFPLSLEVGTVYLFGDRPE